MFLWNAFCLLAFKLDKMKLKKNLLFFLLIPLFAFTLHKYYISLCEIEYNQEKKSDFQNAIDTIDKEYFKYFIVFKRYIISF